MSKSVSQSFKLGTYQVSVDGTQTKLKVPKISHLPNGDEVSRDMWIPMTKMVVKLTSPKGGSVTFQATSMGKKTTVSRLTDLPVELVKNVTAHGDALVVKPGSGKAQPIRMDDALTSIIRMTGTSMSQADELFDFDALTQSVQDIAELKAEMSE